MVVRWLVVARHGQLVRWVARWLAAATTVGGAAAMAGWSLASRGRKGAEEHNDCSREQGKRAMAVAHFIGRRLGFQELLMILVVHVGAGTCGAHPMGSGTDTEA